jgi:two-component system chemotaxis response regulator CheY
VPTSTLDASNLPVRPAQGGTARILYAEDLRELREVMRVIVEAQGYQIETVSDGDEALQRLTDEPGGFDLLITDHHMPRMNGLELVQRLAASGFKGKVMVFSSELDPAVHRAYHGLGVPVILPKPIRPAVLRKSLAELLPVS